MVLADKEQRKWRSQLKGAREANNGHFFLFLIKVNYVGVVGVGGDEADSVFDICHQKQLLAEPAPGWTTWRRLKRKKKKSECLRDVLTQKRVLEQP